MLQNAKPLKKSAPGPLTSLMNIFCTVLQMSHVCYCFWNCHKTFSLLASDDVHDTLRLQGNTTSERPKKITFQPPQLLWILEILTSKSSSHHNSGHCFQIATSKSALNLQCFWNFDVQTCFAPQRCKIFHFSPDQKTPHPRFSKPTFGPSRASNHWKTQCLATFLPFQAPTSSFFWFFLSDLVSPSLLFSSPLWSDSSHLWFSICPCCWKFDFYTSFCHCLHSFAGGYRYGWMIDIHEPTSYSKTSCFRRQTCDICSLGMMWCQRVECGSLGGLMGVA